MEKLKKENEKMNYAMQHSNLKNEIDPNFVNDLYLKMINKFYGML
jgi:hypothetical protein